MISSLFGRSPAQKESKPPGQSSRLGGAGSSSGYAAEGIGLYLAAPNKVTSISILATNKKKIHLSDLKVVIKGPAPVKPTIVDNKDNTFKVTYKLPMSGQYLITAAVGATAVEGSPFKCHCQPSKPSDEKTKVELLGGGEGYAGERYTALVHVFDQFGKPFSGDAALRADVLDAENAQVVLFAADVIADQETINLYRIMFTPQISGAYCLSVYFDGRTQQAHGSPFPLKIRSDESIARNCKLFGGNLTEGTAGERSNFKIQAVDGKNNARTVGGDQFEVTVEGPDGKQITAAVKDNMDGTHEAFWSAEAAGEYAITAVLEGGTVGGCPVTCQVLPAPLDPPRCSCEGEGLRIAVAGQPATFTIKAVDRFYNPRTAGGDEFQVLLSKTGRRASMGTIEGRVEYLGGGLYRGSVVASYAGSYNLLVLSGGVDVSGSPFPVDVEPEEVDPQASRVFGPGLQSVQLGRECFVYVELTDNFGNQVVVEPQGIGLSVVVEGPSVAPVVDKGPKDGVHAFAYKPTAAGAYTISARVNGLHVRGSPATVAASTATAKSTLCEIKGHGTKAALTAAVAGEAVDFTVLAKDASGTVKSVGGDVFELSWEDPEGRSTTGKVHDLGTGEYAMSFCSARAGPHTVSVRLGGADVGGSPMTVQVSPAAVAAACSTAQGAALEASRAGQACVFYVTPMDQFSNPVLGGVPTGPGGFEVAVTGPAEVPSTLAAAVEGTSQLQGRFQPRVAGAYLVAVTYKGEHVVDSPWSINVSPDKARASRSQVISMPSSCVAGGEEVIRVAAFDLDGNRSLGGDHVTVDVDDGYDLSRLSVEGVGGGLYEAVLRPTRAGLVTMVARVNDEVVHPTPCTIPIAAAEICRLLAPRSDAGTRVVAGGAGARLSVVGQDAFGNALSSGGARLEGSIVTNKGSTREEVRRVEVLDCGNGTYTAAAPVTSAGDLELRVEIEGRPDTAVALQGICLPGATDPSKCSVDGSGLEGWLAGHVGVVSVQRVDQLGNRIRSGAGEAPLCAEATGPGPADVEVVEVGDGTVELRITARASGRYVVTAFGSETGQKVEGFPLEAFVDPAPVEVAACRATAQGIMPGEGTAMRAAAGGAVDVVVELRDSYGNLTERKDSHVEVQLDGPGGSVLKEVGDDGGGRLTFRGAPSAAGHLVARVLVGGQPVPGWPRMISVAAGRAAAGRCVVKGEALRGVVCGAAAGVMVQACDAYGNLVSEGGEEVEVALEGPGGARRAVEVTDNTDGTYSCMVAAAEAGRWVVRVKVGREEVREEGFEVEAAYGPVQADDCVAETTAQGEVVCGAEAEVIIRARVAGRKFSGREGVSVRIRGGAGAGAGVAAVLCEGGLAYRAGVAFMGVGAHTVEACMDGEPIEGSPFSVYVAPSAPFLENFNISGAGLSRCVAGEAAAFTVQAADIYGNLIRKGGARLSLVASVADVRSQGRLADNSNGTYEGQYTVDTAGEVNLVITLDTGGSQYTKRFRAVCCAARTSPARCVVEESPARHPGAGAWGCILIRRADRFGNRLLSSGGEAAFEASARGPGPAEVVVREGGDGSVEVAYRAHAAGSYTLSVAAAGGGQAVKGTPLEFDVTPGAAAAARCKAAVAGAAAGRASLMAGEEVDVTVDLHDEHGNRTSDAGPDGVAVELSGEGGGVLEEVGDDGGGRLTFRGAPSAAGHLVARVLVGGQPVPGWPRMISVAAGRAAAGRCVVKGEALRGVVCGAAAGVMVQACDAYGNLVSEGGEEVEVALEGPGGARRAVEVTDNTDGTYSCMVAAAEAGRWVVRVKVGREEVREEGFEMDAAYGPVQADDCVAETTAQGEVVCGAEAEVIIRARVAGRKFSGREGVSVRIRGGAGAGAGVAAVLCEGGLAYRAGVAFMGVGAHTVEACMDGEPIEGSPFHVVVAPEALDPLVCTVSGLSSVKPVAAGMPFVFSVQGRDRFGNPRPLDPDDVAVETLVPDAFTSAQVDTGADPSSVDVAVVPAAAGGVMMRVLVADDPRPVASMELPVRSEGAAKLRRVGGAQQLAAVAGVPGTLVVEAVGSASARSMIEVTASMHAGGARVPLDVVSRSSGMYAVRYTAATAGDFEVHVDALGGGGGVLVIPGSCAPGPTSPGHCSIETAGLEGWRAGTAGVLRVLRSDALGNRVLSPAGAGFAAAAFGPGPVLAEVVEGAAGADAGVAEVRLLARASGRYRIQVWSTADGAPVAGTPLEAEVIAAPPVADRCSYLVQGLDGENTQVAAGARVLVQVDARDAYGNPAELPPSRVAVTAAGAAGTVTFAPTSGAGDGAGVSMACEVPAAGQYDLRVLLLGEEGAERTPLQPARHHLSVLPGPVSPAHTIVHAPEKALVAGQPTDVLLVPRDCYGNTGALGGVFEAAMEGPDGRAPCRVVEYSQPSRSIKVQAVSARSGAPRLLVTVSGGGDGDGAVVVADLPLKVKDGETAPRHCRVSGYWPPSGAVVGVAAGFVVTAYDKCDNQRASGGDRFLVEIAGARTQVTDRGDGTYAVEYIPTSEGTLKASVTLGPAHVSGSPLALACFRDIEKLADKAIDGRLSSTVAAMRRRVADARSLHASLRAEARALQDFLPVLVESTGSGIREAMQAQARALEESKAAFQREAVERKRLHNLVQELQGNIRVYVRVKPLDAEEAEVGVAACVEVREGRRVLCEQGGQSKAFEFDKAFGPAAGQAEIFEDISALVTSALDGYNVCTFAYGQTGAGKTHTMEGTKEDPGINFRTVAELFRCIKEERGADYTYVIRASIVEIYNEVVRDLLSEEGSRDAELVKVAGGFRVPGLTKVDVTSPEQIISIMAKGFEVRAQGCHDVNAHSSRSHCLLVIEVEGTNASTHVCTTGKLTLCDLAGSERISKTRATGLTLTEAQNINSSLLALGNVISALLAAAQHVPYRNSKLTMLLQDSLGGDAKALMLCNLAPSPKHAAETLSSLAFASKVSAVVLGSGGAPPRHVADADAGAAAKAAAGGSGRGKRPTTAPPAGRKVPPPSGRTTMRT